MNAYTARRRARIEREIRESLAAPNDPTYLAHEQPYFPPKGSRFAWGPKQLTNRPWICNRDTLHRSCRLYVYLTSRGYRGNVDFVGVLGEERLLKHTRYFKDPLKALKATEDLSDRMIAAEKLPKWAEEALALGWRPPARGK